MMRTLALVGILALLLPAAGAQSLSMQIESKTQSSTSVTAQDATVDTQAHQEAHVDADAQAGMPQLAPQETPQSSTQQSDDETGSSPMEVTPEAAAVGVGALVGVGAIALSWAGLKGATASLFAPLFSRIKPNRMLENEMRNRVNTLVSENPGITIKEVTALLCIGWGTAVYHLKRLESERLVVSERHRQFRRYYKNGGGIVNETKAAFGELKNPTNQALAALLLDAPGTCQKDLCQRVGISAPLAHKYLSRLVSAGLVSTQKEWKSVRYYPTPQLEGLWPSVHASTPGPTLPSAVPQALAVTA